MADVGPPVRRTKIVATVGPASNTPAAIRDLVAAGVDVFRLNFSHGTHAGHGEAITLIRAAAAEAGRQVAILQDLSGPKIRTGQLKDHQPLVLEPGATLVIAAGSFEGVPGRVSTSYRELPGRVRPGDTLLLDDGRLQLRVESTSADEIRTIVVDGGLLGERKGINAPGVALPASGLTAKDLEDLRFGVASGVDFVAMSFVQTAGDLRQARAALAEAGAPDLPLVAKLERPEAVEQLDEILRACDAVMVARGDLGLELPLETVPRVQKEITRRARALGVPVIVATQVFESMMKEPRPTRAEVSDAANAVGDGADAIMLAGETAAGAYPLKAVQTLDLVLRDAERVASMPVPLRGSARARRARPGDVRGGDDAGRPRPRGRDRGGDARRQDRWPAVGAAAGHTDRGGHGPAGRGPAAGAVVGRRAGAHDPGRHRRHVGDAARYAAGRAPADTAGIGDCRGEHGPGSEPRAVEFPEGAGSGVAGPGVSTRAQVPTEPASAGP